MSRWKIRTLQGKIFAYVFPFLIIPSLLSFYVLDRPLERNVEEKVGKSVQEALNLVRFNMEQTLGEMMTAATLLTLDADMIHALREGGGKPNYDTYNAATTLFRKAIGISLSHIEYRLTVVPRSGEYYYSSSGAYFTGDDLHALTSSSWYEELRRPPLEFKWLFQETAARPPIVTLGRAIVDPSTKQILGTALVSVPYPGFGAILQQMDGEVWLIDTEGRRLAMPGSVADGEFSDKSNDAALFQRMRGSDRGQFSMEWNRKRWMINYDTIKLSGWKIVQRVSHDSVFKEISRIRTINVIVIGIIFTLFTLLMFVLSRKITRPLRLLRLKMLQLDDARLSTYLTVPTKNKDEVSDLIEAYNRMLGQIKELLANLQQEQKHKENMRFKALQAQMNPHFLLNTMNNIKWIAYMRQDNEVAEMIASLAVIVEAGIGRGEDRIPLRKELEYIESYIGLHRIKLNDRLVLTQDVPGDCLDCEVVKFSLQPLVENCIQHGFARRDAGGLIRIEAERTHDKLMIRVADNGEGLAPDKLQELQRRLDITEPDVQHERLGLLNLHERLRLTFGMEYGLQIANGPEGGCIVTVCMPYRALTDNGKRGLT